MLTVDPMQCRHGPILETRLARWPDEAACAALAADWSRRPALRDATIELDGDLGAGKTTFARHLLRALGVEGRIKSPTFAVLEPYVLPNGGAVSHFDFYRFDALADGWDDAGFRERFAAPGLKLSEWAGQAGPSLPRPDLRLTIRVEDDDRRGPDADALPPARCVRADAFTPRGAALLW